MRAILVGLISALAMTTAHALTPIPMRVQTDGGEVSVDHPDGAWDCKPRQAAQGPQNQVWMIKCKSTAPDDFFFMIAKVYTVPPDKVVPAEKLVRGFKLGCAEYTKIRL